MNSLNSIPDQFSSLKKSVSFWRRVVWGSAIAVVIPPLFGLLGTVTSMVRAFGEIGQAGEVKHKDLAGDISITMLTTMRGLVISFSALLVFAIALTFFLRRRKALREIVEDQLIDDALE